MTSEAPEKGWAVNHNPHLRGEQNEILKPSLVPIKENQAVAVDITVCFQSKFVFLNASTRKTDEYKNRTEQTNTGNRGKVRLISQKKTVLNKLLTALGFPEIGKIKSPGGEKLTR